MIINIGFAFDNTKDANYWKYLTTTICQMLGHTRIDNQYNIYIIAPQDFINDIKSIVTQNATMHNWTINILKPLNDFNDNDTSRWSISTYWRLYFSKLLPNIDKIAYFDSDVFFNCDVADFYNIDVNGCHVAGVIDSISLQILKNPKLHKNQLCNRPLSLMDKYLCAGVLLMNLKLIREDEMYDKFIQSFERHWPFKDQDIINDICKKKTLSIEWGGYNSKYCLPFYREYGMLTRKQLKDIINNKKIINNNWPKFW
jgi:lipopolysaccharide biosynthesis glycosyltransferase